jgi:RNA polymerase sigma-70 factor (ECF subfamily)
LLAERHERAAMVWEAIRRLPPEQREAIILRDWHGLSYKEIAQVQGVSTGVVGSRLFDAREKLRKHLKGRL